MKILLILLLISFKSYAYFEIGLSYGRSFGNKIGTFTAKNGGVSTNITIDDVKPLHHPGITLDITKPSSRILL